MNEYNLNLNLADFALSTTKLYKDKQKELRNSALKGAVIGSGSLLAVDRGLDYLSKKPYKFSKSKTAALIGLGGLIGGAIGINRQQFKDRNKMGIHKYNNY